MTVRKFSRAELESEPHDVLFKDLYPWDEIPDTPFGASLAIVQPGGRTMLHGHDPAETFIISRGTGTITIDGVATQVSAGDVIYLHPQSIHDLRNDSATEELVFVSVFWDAEARPRASDAPKLIVPAPPTASGPLHVGHLAGPYLIADVVRRYQRARGVPATLVCVMDEHQSYVLDRAQLDGVSAAATAARFSDAALRVLAAFDAAPDACVYPSRDAGYRAEVQRRFARLLAEGKLEARATEELWCEACELVLYDGFVLGRCPHCDAESFGALCDGCCRPNDSIDLVAPTCDRCQHPATRRPARRLVFPIAPHAGALAEHHRRLTLPPRLRRLAAELCEQLAPVTVSQPSAWGIAVGVDGFAGQVISPWFEISLAATELAERTGAAQVACFGVDNAFLYLVLDPAVALALGAPLPTALVPNEHLLLGDAKMSTSRAHALDAEAVLAKLPSDLLRLYLAKLRPEDARTSLSVPAGQMFLNMIAQHWQAWLARLGACVAREAGSVAPAFGRRSAEQAAFLAQLKALVARARASYDACSLKEIGLVLPELVERAASFGETQRQLAGIASLEGERATGLALELAAARTLAMIAAPVMPRFAQALWTCLGHAGPVAWTDGVEPVPPGSRIATEVLIARRFFPAVIELT